MLFRTLSSEGVAVDPVSLAAEFKDSTSSEKNKETEKTINMNSTSSSTLYVLADRIQHEF
jgi:hypothetical protein